MPNFTEISELYHHGIKGMKWGIRRYLNEDGTLTDEGKKKYGSTDKLRKLAQKELNRNERGLEGQIVSLTDASLNMYKSEHKLEKYKNKENAKEKKIAKLENKYEKDKAIKDQIEKDLKTGQAEIKKIFDTVGKTDLNVYNTAYKRYTTKGSKLLSSYIKTTVYTTHGYKVQTNDKEAPKNYTKNYININHEYTNPYEKDSRGHELLEKSPKVIHKK